MPNMFIATSHNYKAVDLIKKKRKNDGTFSTSDDNIACYYKLGTHACPRIKADTAGILMFISKSGFP